MEKKMCVCVWERKGEEKRKEKKRDLCFRRFQQREKEGRKEGGCEMYEEWLSWYMNEAEGTEAKRRHRKKKKERKEGH